MLWGLVQWPKGWPKPLNGAIVAAAVVSAAVVGAAVVGATVVGAAIESIKRVRRTLLLFSEV